MKALWRPWCWLFAHMYVVKPKHGHSVCECLRCGHVWAVKSDRWSW